MKLMKAMKRLKFWPRLKKRKKCHFLPPSSPPRPPPSRPPPPPPLPPYYHHLHNHYEPLLPSAPPLPPWLEYDMQFDETPQISSPSPGANISSPRETMDHEHASQLSEEIQDIPLSQQDNNFVLGRVEGDEYDVVPELRKLEKRGEFLGAFGCVVGFGEHLVRCVFPCFCIKEKGREGEGAIAHTTNTNTNTYGGLIGH